MKNKELLTGDIYLFPFNTESLVMFHVLKHNGFDVKAFCDSSEALQGKNYNGTPVIPLVKGENETVIITAHRLYIHANLFAHSLKIEQFLTAEDFEYAYPLVDKEFICENIPRQKVVYDWLHQQIKQVILPDDAKYTINTLNVSVTDRCNLRCKHCGALMQYMQHPQHISLNSLKNDMNMLFSKVDFIRDIHILGGEPFLYPELAEYLNFLSERRERIGSLYIITNGTIIPKPEVIKAIANSKTLVRISDYTGAVPQKIDQIISTFAEYGAEAQLVSFEWNWENQLTYDDPADRQKKYNCCFAKNFNNCLKNGKLYLCDFLENAELLHMIPYSDDHHLELKNANRDDITKFLSNDVAPLGCDYCSGHDHAHPIVIPAAEQISAPLTYKSFDETYK
jgi:organic radical activating enzyme